jgi:hypothetical protein
MGVSDETKNVIPLKFLRKIKKKKIPSCKLNPGTYCRQILSVGIKLLIIIITYLKKNVQS